MLFRSLGIATLSDGMQSADDLVKEADSYLYKAKRAGRNCIGGYGIRAIEAASHSATTVVKKA